MKPSRAWLLAALLLPVRAGAGSRQLELGLENYFYRTADTPLNRDNVLALERNEDLLRGTLAWRESWGPARAAASGFVERSLGSRDRTEWTARQAYLQYTFGEGALLRAGKQRVGWGSGLAWNPTNRVEPPKNPANLGLEQEGAWAARADWLPASWAGVILLAAQTDTNTTDLPFDAVKVRRRTAAVRARFLLEDTDLALVFSGGKNQSTLLGLDAGRTLGNVAWHAEAAFYQGAELQPARPDERFLRLVAGLLWTRDETALAAEYFYNQEGYDAAQMSAYLALLEASGQAASDPTLPAAVREAARRRYLAAAGIPYAGGLGLRRHYLYASWSRTFSAGRITTAARGVVGLADGGSAVTPGLAWSPSGNLTLHLDAVLLLGPENSEYRLAPLRAAVQTRLKLSF